MEKLFQDNIYNISQTKGSAFSNKEHVIALPSDFALLKSVLGALSPRPLYEKSPYKVEKQMLGIAKSNFQIKVISKKDLLHCFNT